MFISLKDTAKEFKVYSNVDISKAKKLIYMFGVTCSKKLGQVGR